MSDGEAPTPTLPEAPVAPIVGEIVPDEIDKMIKASDAPMLAIARQLSSFNWRDIKPHQTAAILMQKPFPVSGGGTLFLNFKQALFLAIRCYELGVSPYSTEVWFDPGKWSVNLTLEGKRKVARNQNIDLGPAKFERLERPYVGTSEVITAAKAAGFTVDVGYKCSMRVGDRAEDRAEYTAWLSEWLVPRSPVWKAKPEHMLQIRAQEKAITFALGTGVSALPDEAELGN